MNDIIEKFLPYRGDIKALGASENTVYFITEHPEKQLTPCYQLNLETQALSEIPLNNRASALLVSKSPSNKKDQVWIGDIAGGIYCNGKRLTQLADDQNTSVNALVALSQQRLGVLIGRKIEIIDQTKGTQLQTLELSPNQLSPEKSETGTAIAADASGQWLVVGTNKGTVLVFENEDEDQTAFKLSESDKLHEGAVTALAFDPTELRFLSAGNDNKLLLTHARGKLEPEDRDRGAGHAAPITAIVHPSIQANIQTTAERFITGAQDKTCKSWLRSGATRPSTFSEGIGSVTGLAIAAIHHRPHLVVASNQRLAVVALDAAGKFGQLTHRIYDTYALAKNELASAQVTHRQAAIERLASYGDKASLQLLDKQVRQDRDFALRQLIAERIATTNHPDTQRLVESYLNHKDEAIRTATFARLQERFGSDEPLRPMTLALKTGQTDVGKLAVNALANIAAEDERAMMRLTDALDAKAYPVRMLALARLESVNSEANIVALGASHADVRRASLIRLFQRALLEQPRVLSTLRRRLDDSNTEVRQTAFLVSLFSRPALAKAIRERDKHLHRLLFDIEEFDIEQFALEAGLADQSTSAKSKSAKPKPVESKPAEKAKELPKTRKTKLALTTADYAPLLQATASLSLDSCLLGAHCLALLNDPRAFGLLLQLSRAEDSSARVRVCHALANLNDPRTDQRLQTLLNDSATEVRDAAFTALAAIHESQPLTAVQLGLTSQHADVRRRALQSLVRVAKKDEVSTVHEALFQHALNDGTPNVRSEAFKAVLNLPMGGSQESALRFALQSTHADIRREVQTELIAEASQSWAWALLLALFSDPDQGIRYEALAFTLKKTKGRDYAPLAAALKSPYRDTRLTAISELSKKPGEQSQQLLISAINDSERDVRKQAIQALVDAKANAALKQAMRSEYQDVVLQAANACARLGDDAALEPLLSLVTLTKPENKDDAKRWQATIESALTGLSQLQSPACVPAVAPLLASDISAIRRAAAKVLTWCCDVNQQEVLEKALQHQDSEVKLAAAHGLVLLDNTHQLAMQQALAQSRSQPEKLLCVGALIGFGDECPDRLSSYLDDPDHLVSFPALVVHLLQGYKGQSPTHLLAMLSVENPMFRLIAAQAIEHFHHQEAYTTLLSALFNTQSGEKWQISNDVIELFAELVISGNSRLRCKTLQLLAHLFADKQDAWDHAWQHHTQRYQTEINGLLAAVGKPKSAKTKPTQAKSAKIKVDQTELEQMAFGTYCGLVREQGKAAGRRKVAYTDSSIITVRQSALTLLSAMCQRDTSLLAAAESVFMQALGDPNQAVRLYALDQLQILGTDTSLLANECLETGHNDLGVKALEMLTEGESLKQGQAILQQAMVSRTDDLALEAAKLLLKTSNPITVAKPALDAVDRTVRLRAIDWLADDYDNPKAQTLLHKALNSRHPEVQESSTYALAVKKDTKAFDALVTLLSNLLLDHSARGFSREQRRAIQALVKLGDPKGANALLDLIEQLEPLANTTSEQISTLFEAAGNFRETTVASRLLTMMDKPGWQQGAYLALLSISGYDQPIEDPEDEKVDKSWLEQQHPRHDQLLKQLLERCVELGKVNLILGLIDAARWSPTDAVNDVLATLTHHADNEVRELSVYALGWRIRKRNGPSTGVVNALTHQHPITQFWAAYCLALAGNAQGISILLAGVDTLADLKLRQYAVQALGKLGDERALDTLLRLAKDDEHALQEVAAEAIGHLGQSDQAETIFELLQRFVTSDRWGLVINGLHGLRYFDTHAGWQLVREKAVDAYFFGRETALEVLGYNNDPATQDLLLAVLAEDGANYYGWGAIALNSARRLFGGDALAPDYAFLSCGAEAYRTDDDFSRSLQRVCQTGEAKEIFRILPDCANGVRTQLAMSLLNREPLPLKEATTALSSPHMETVEVAATLMGYSSATAKAGIKAIEAALANWATQWAEMRELERKGMSHYHADESENLSRTLQRLVWVAGVADCSADSLLSLANAHQDDPAFSDIRFAVYTALATIKPTSAIQSLMAEAIFHTDSRIRSLAAAVINNTKATPVEALAAQAVSDRLVYQQLTQRFDAKSLNEANLSNAHLQGIVLPQVVNSQNTDALLATTLNSELAENTRLGAIEALAQVASTKGESALVKVATNESLDEDLRKMAWRCLRRSKRVRAAGKNYE
ncbi:HEAT repeat domain-containing protein [Endozoicomonas sp. SM1973]|uniref:HEAT repeat domain-containing protein n=1 Tax=Spartinivicinus marinus TaxID=2994442 RepID=A0A853HWF5_9GAMM|nr:HEAT repeat domain-containing protein [Spartinivicinus marinus]MCX4027209.1 HEAT repeat domain-containing protein [Spartinivicinus marinus]NYZ66070.1 HEAT repeat domain-containing protein [Spartinivicinus marinus]